MIDTDEVRGRYALSPAKMPSVVGELCDEIDGLRETRSMVTALVFHAPAGAGAEEVLAGLRAILRAY